MAAYHRVYDLRHLQISSGTLRSVIEYGLPLPFSVGLLKDVNF